MTQQLPADWFLRSRLKMRHILLLVAIDDQRSIHKAATALHMTQPGATKLLSELENLLELRLFERTTRGLVPTPHGESLVRHARAILGTLDHARAELGALSEGSTGKIAMGVLLVAEPVLAPRAIARVKLLHPNLTVLVQEGTLPGLLPALRRGELDLVVGRLTTDFDSRGLHFEACYDEPMSVVVRVDHALATRLRLKLDAIADEAWILPTPDTAYRRRIDAAFRQRGVEPPSRIVESVSILLNMTLLQESEMLAVMPHNVARHYAVLGAVKILDVELPQPSGPVGMITRVGHPTTRMLDDLRSALREAGQRIVSG